MRPDNIALQPYTVRDLTARDFLGTLVAFELDAYWAARAGRDPLKLLRLHAGRVPLLHLKDLAAGPDKADAPVGEGTLPWPAIMTAADSAGVEGGVVEQDHPRDALADVEPSLRNLQRLMAE